jgi:hypothetical protein
MESCIVAINSGHERYMGYASSQKIEGMSFKISNLPVFKSGKNLLVGVYGCDNLLTFLKNSPLILSNENPPSQILSTIKNSIPEQFKSGEVLILSSNNFIYRWHNGLVDLFSEFDENFIAIGKGKEIALGTLYGSNTSRFTIKEQMEVCLKAVKEFYPELGKSTGHFNI